MTPHDDERLSALYRAGTQEEPPSHLDQQIREAARRHAPPRHRGWIPALATAAVLVLAVAVMIRVPDERTDERAREAPAPAEEAPSAAPAVGSSARKEIAEDAASQAKPRKTEQPPAPRFEYYQLRPPTKQPETPVIRGLDARQQAPASAAAVAADEARASADSVDHENIDARRLETEADRCRPPDAMFTEDREMLLKRIEELERRGRHDEAECLRLWLEDAPLR